MSLGWVYVIIILEQIVASGTFLAAKWALLDFPPLTLAFFRFVIAASGLFLVRRVWPGRRPIERMDYARIALLGFLAVVINQGFFLYGLEFTTPTHAALLYGATPVFVYLFAIVLIKERRSVKKFAGVVVTFAGVGVIVSRSGIDWSGTSWRGDLLILLAVLAWALYTVLGKPMVKKYGAVHVTAVSLVTGTLMFLPFGVFTVSGFDVGTVTARGWWSLLYIAIGTSVIAYTVWFWALGRLEATKVAVFNNLQPIVTAILSYLLLGERVGPRLIAGGVMIILGVVLTERG